jgi:hypothetical protein
VVILIKKKKEFQKKKERKKVPLSPIVIQELLLSLSRGHICSLPCSRLHEGFTSVYPTLYPHWPQTMIFLPMPPM